MLDIEDLFNAQALNPLEMLIEQEAWTQQVKHVEQLLQAVSGEPELEQIVQLIISGCEPRPRYLATESGVPVNEINTRLKRLRRRALRLGKDGV